MRERGPNTARPTEKGIGGLPIGARPVDSARRFGRVLSRFVVPVVSIRSCLLCRSCRFGVLLVSRFGVPVVPIRSCRVEVKAQTQKKPDSSIGESGSAIARRRALLTFR